MDQALQVLVQRWRATGDVEDGVRAAQARARAGLLTADDARLAATLGDPVALALGHLPLEVPPLDLQLVAWRGRAGLPCAPRLEHLVALTAAPLLRVLFADAALRHLGAPDAEAHAPVVRRLAGALREGDADACRAAAEGVEWRMSEAGDWRDAIMDGTLQPEGGAAAVVIAAAACHEGWARALQVALGINRRPALRQAMQTLSGLPGPELGRQIDDATNRAGETERDWLERRLAGLLVWGAGALPPPDPFHAPPPPTPTPTPTTTTTPPPGALARAWRWLTGAPAR